MEAQGKVVSALDERQQLDGVEEFYLSAFLYLSPSRNSGMGISAIRLPDIVLYHSVFGAPHQVDSFARIVHSIDMAYIKTADEERAKKAKRKH